MRIIARELEYANDIFSSVSLVFVSGVSIILFYLSIKHLSFALFVSERASERGRGWQLVGTTMDLCWTHDDPSVRTGFCAVWNVDEGE
jgi:hypothetical protein